jgi:hypothetical protein
MVLAWGTLYSIYAMVEHPRRLPLIARVRAFNNSRPDRMAHLVMDVGVYAVLIVWLLEFPSLVKIEIALPLLLKKINGFHNSLTPGFSYVHCVASVILQSGSNVPTILPTRRPCSPAIFCFMCYDSCARLRHWCPVVIIFSIKVL